MARWRDIKNNKTSKEAEKKTLDDSILPTSLFSRFKSFLVDSFMITMPIIYFVIYIVMGSGDEFSQDKAYGWSIIFILHAIAILGFLIIKKETPGMRAYNLKLVNSNTQKSINIFQIIIRYILTILSSLTILGLIPFFRKDKKTLQDILSGTYLIVNDKNSSN